MPGLPRFLHCWRPRTLTWPDGTQRTKVTVGVPVEYYSPGCRQHSRVSLAFGRCDLRLFPNYLSALNIERTQVLLPGFLLETLCLPTAGRKPNNALLQGHDVIETCHRA